MPLTTIFENRRLVERTRRVRQNPLLAYGTAIFTVAAATLLRQLIGGQAIEGLPFITYYPAIVIVALLGGFWPGILAILLSAVAAWYLFLPPAFSLELTKPELVSLLLFILTAGINVIIVALLNAAVERIMAQEQNTGKDQTCQCGDRKAVRIWTQRAGGKKRRAPGARAKFWDPSEGAGSFSGKAGSSRHGSRA